MSLDASVRVGIIGPGRAAGLHAQALTKVTNAELVGVAGRDLARARVFADKHRVVAFGSVDAMLGSGEVDAVVVSPPIQLMLSAPFEPATPACMSSSKNPWPSRSPTATP